ncbi:hypothetical protein [Streptomyces sp.]|uniref:hypothetical protein n=1 Tax=Streptomyces sp. TaxID=1931 RepID=UPI002D583D84|nr:hypothetical protein [Streptomyces sp.]HZF87631.1 hypothetical protein [Streptomyces sp.]
MPSLTRARPRRATSHISARVAHAVLGAVLAVLWLVLPGLTTAPDARAPAGPGPSASAQREEVEETTTADLVLPLLALSAAVVLGAYGYVRRGRRARTGPGGPPAGPVTGAPLADLDERARTALVAADDWVRTSREELDFAELRLGTGAVAPYARTLAAARAELTEAFRMRRRYDEGVPGEQAARRQALAGIVGRCAEAGRLLDEQAAGLDRLRDLEGGIGGALEIAEARFRELTGRTGAAEAALAELAGRYPPAARAPVAGYAEQAKDRLVFATARLNRARQCADRGEHGRAVAHLRAAEGAVAQADLLVTAVGRLAAELAEATALVPAALTGAEAELAGARERAGAAADPGGEPRARILHADAVLAAVREELTAGPYDPLDLLHRIVRATAPVATGRAGVLPAAAALVARSAVAAAEDFVATHRGAAGAEARTRLVAARDAERAEPLAAEALARQARQLAERDVRAHGHPDAVPGTGTAGALLGGILLGPDPAAAPAASFGGPGTRARRSPEPS